MGKLWQLSHGFGRAPTGWRVLASACARAGRIMSCCALQAESYNQALRAVPPTGPPPYARAPVLCAVSVAFSSYREARAAHIKGAAVPVCVCVCVSWSRCHVLMRVQPCTSCRASNIACENCMQDQPWGTAPAKVTKASPREPQTQVSSQPHRNLARHLRRWRPNQQAWFRAMR